MHSDKPISLSVRDYIVRRLSSRMRISEADISAVIVHQYSTGNSSTRTNNEIEFSGLGKFMFSPKKALFRAKKLLSIKEKILFLRQKDILPSKIEEYNKKLESLDEELKYIETKTNELDTTSGPRMEK